MIRNHLNRNHRLRLICKNTKKSTIKVNKLNLHTVKPFLLPIRINSQISLRWAFLTFKLVRNLALVNLVKFLWQGIGFLGLFAP